MVLIAACGRVEKGAVSVKVDAPTTNEEEDQNLPSPTPAVGSEVVDNEEEGEETDGEIENVPSPTVSPLDMELIGQKKDFFDTLFQTRIDNLLTWDIGQDFSEKADKMDYQITQLRDYPGVFTTEVEDRKWSKEVFPTIGHYQKRICGEAEYLTVSFSSLLITYADNTTANIRIEMAFDDSNFTYAGDPLPIKYISLDLKKSTDEEAQGWVNQSCN